MTARIHSSRYLGPVLFVVMGMHACAQAGSEQDSDFAARCAMPGVVKCVGFDAAIEVPLNPNEQADKPAIFGVYANDVVPPELDTSVAASGKSSLKFTIPSNSGSSAGSYFTNFADDFSVQFGTGSRHGNEFFVQWRQRFSSSFLSQQYYRDWVNREHAGGWKQIIIGEGDRPGANIHSCTDLEIVVQNTGQRGFAQVYHSCGSKDSNYEGLNEPYGAYDFLLQNAIRSGSEICSYEQPNSPPCFGYVSDEWMTFQIRVQVGTPYDNDNIYRHDSIIQLWIGREGQPSRLVLDFSPKDPSCQNMQYSLPDCQTGYDLYNDNPQVRQYGQVWLLPYHSGKDSAQPHETGFVWYDELIIAKFRIPDPGAP